MFEKSKRWICKFIVLFLFITGMCFDEVKADSVFVCTIITESAAKIQTFSEKESVSVYRDNDADATEMLVARSTSDTQQLIAPISTGKRTLKLFVALIYITALMLLLSNPYGMAYIAQMPERVCKTIVVNYIHNTDGKKRV